MFGSPRYNDPARPDVLTGYATLSPFTWREVRSALERGSKKKKKTVKVDLTGDGESGNSWALANYLNPGPNNTGADKGDGMTALKSITFKLDRKRRITRYSVDAVDDNFDFTLTLKNANGKPTPAPLKDIFKTDDLYRSSGLGEAYAYFDMYAWGFFRYSTLSPDSGRGMLG